VLAVDSGPRRDSNTSTMCEPLLRQRVSRREVIANDSPAI
jgi:hypothetical protein